MERDRERESARAREREMCACVRWEGTSAGRHVRVVNLEMYSDLEGDGEDRKSVV